jgi:hypothetical protein
VLLAEHAAAFVQLLAGAETLAARVFTTRVLEQTVQLVSAQAPVLVALVASEALTPLEAFVEAAAGERDAELHQLRSKPPEGREGSTGERAPRQDASARLGAWAWNHRTL